MLLYLAHENSRTRQGCRAAASTCRCVGQGRFEFDGNWSSARSRLAHGSPLESCASATWGRWAGDPYGAGTHVPFDQTAVARSLATTRARRDSAGVCVRSVDLSSDCAIHRTSVPGHLPRGSYSSINEVLGLLRAKARTSSTRTRRRRDSCLDRADLAETEKKATRRRASLVFIDETGVFLTPFVHRTWAPRGQTPLLQT